MVGNLPHKTPVCTVSIRNVLRPEVGRGAHFGLKMVEMGALSFDRFCKSASYYAPERERATKTGLACGLDAGFGLSLA